MSDRKLAAWVEAGLIDEAAAERIRQWEAHHARPLGLWALFGVAALAILLGLISVIAANWDAIIGEARLALHMALMLGLAGWLWWRKPQVEAAAEALLFILAALGLTFFGHLGQVYQTSSPLWQPLALWLLLFSPLLLGFGRSWLTAAGWFAGFAGTILSLLAHLMDTRGDEMAPFIVGLMAAAPGLAVPFAAWMRDRSERPGFWRRLEQVALIFAVAGISQALILIAFADDSWKGEQGMGFATYAGMALLAFVAAGLTWIGRPTRSGRAVAAILAAGGALLLLSQAMLGADTGAALLFMAFWAAIAAASLTAGWRHVFQAAIAIFALRLIVLSFEWASDLLASGVGLIIAGLFTLAVAWAAVRVSKRFAPKEDAA